MRAAAGAAARAPAAGDGAVAGAAVRPLGATTLWNAWRGPILLVAGVFVVWQLLYVIAGEMAMRSPAQTFAYIGRLLSGERIWPHIHETVKASAMAVFFSIVLGLGIGLTLGFQKLAGEIFEPMLVAIYSIPKLTLYPILLLSFGLGMSAKVAFGAIHGIIPIALFTINAVRNIRPILVKTGRVLNYTPWEMTWRVLIPAALPEIFTGIRIGFALTLIGTLLGEMFASQHGLGNQLMRAIGLHDVDLIMAIAFMLTALAAVGSGILLAIDRRLHRRI
jgi:NitT/TauT family transport system permease protein